MKDEYGRKITQGHDKMIRYIGDLVRNKNFQMLLRRLRKYKRHSEGMYQDWTPKEQKEHDRMNREIGSILDGYELLRKRCKRLVKNRQFYIREKIAEEYGLDLYLIMLAEALYHKDQKLMELAKSFADPEMCKIVDIRDEEVHPFNKGEEIIYLNPTRKLRLLAYPIAICINSRASKRDVLDFIEKRWPWISSMSDLEKPFKMRKRKHSQDILDFIWENRGLPAKEIKNRLNKNFPDNGFVYYEISKIIQLEKDRRIGYLT